MAASAPVDSVDATETVPSSSISMRVPVSSWMERIIFPPGPMTAPIFSGLRQRFPHDLRGDPFDLDVHLNGGDALGGARHLEVHVAQGIFHTLDIAQNRRPAGLGFGYESHGDPRPRR